jgi:hypothetical protein
MSCLTAIANSPLASALVSKAASIWSLLCFEFTFEQIFHFNQNQITSFETFIANIVKPDTSG